MAWTILLSDADISTLTTLTAISAGTEARLTASFCNRSASATATVQLWVVPSGETRGNEHLKEAGTTLGLAGTPQAVLERSFVAPSGCVVYVQASTANVSCQVQGDVVAVENSTFSDGTSSITYGTNWGNSILAQTRLIKNSDTLVTLYLAVVASGSPGATIATLPSGYRPPKSVNGIMGTCSISGTSYPTSFLIDTSGAVSIVSVLPSSLGLSTSSGSQIFFIVSFYT